MKDAREFRFAVGTPDMPSSSVWRVWTSGEETFFAARSMARVIKWSLHSSGNWQVNAGTITRSWRRPKEFRAHWTQGPSILVPNLRTVNPLALDAEQLHPDIEWISPPTVGNKLRFTLLFADPGANDDNSRGVARPTDRALAHLLLRDDSGVYLFLREETTTLVEQAELDRFWNSLQISRGAPDNTIQAALLMIITEDSDGLPVVFDVTLSGEHIR